MPQKRTPKKTDREYMKYKMEQMREARERGNEAVVKRHANDLIQYFNVDKRSERPIEEILELERQKRAEEKQKKFDNKFEQIRQAFGKHYDQ